MSVRRTGAAAALTALLLGAGVAGTAGTASAAVGATGETAKCAVNPSTAETVTIGGGTYRLTNLDHYIRTDGPKLTTFALSGTPQNCSGGEFYVYNVLRRQVVPMTSGAMSTADADDVFFRAPTGNGPSFLAVIYGNPATPGLGDWVASASMLFASH